MGYLNGGVHDEAGDVDGAGLTQAVGPPHCLLQDCWVHAGLQQEHMVGCTHHTIVVTPCLCRHALHALPKLQHTGDCSRQHTILMPFSADLLCCMLHNASLWDTGDLADTYLPAMLRVVLLSLISAAHCPKASLHQAGKGLGRRTGQYESMPQLCKWCRTQCSRHCRALRCIEDCLIEHYPHETKAACR